MEADFKARLVFRNNFLFIPSYSFSEKEPFYSLMEEKNV